MNQLQRRLYLIDLLQKEQDMQDVEAVPENEAEQKKLLRRLMNIRPPEPLNPDFLKVQDDYLQEELALKKLTSLKNLTEAAPDLYLWQGDITTLQVDGVVNAANSDLLGCFIPNHNCIDNIIHTNAGLQLRRDCHKLIKRQKGKEPVGKAKITEAYNLPAKYVLHTVGPYIHSKVTAMKEDLLISCYRECLKLADENNLESLAFCCISTGVFRYPNDSAAETAVNTVKKYKQETGSNLKVVFNVFKDLDLKLYQRLLA